MSVTDTAAPLGQNSEVMCKQPFECCEARVYRLAIFSWIEAL
jgi:hypothetical protein